MTFGKWDNRLKVECERGLGCLARLASHIAVAE